MRLSPRQSAANAAPPVRGSDEVLVIDPRGALTPAQMVERKLLALLRTGNPGPYAQAAAGRPGLHALHGDDRAWATTAVAGRPRS